MDEKTYVLAPVASAFRVVRLTLSRNYDGTAASIEVALSDGERGLSWRSDGVDALALLSQLDTRNFSVKSLHQVVLEFLAAQGALGAGTVV